MKRKCQYRNCGCTIPESTRSDSKYCNIKCRGNEMTYLKREKKKIENNKKQIVKTLIEIENNKELLELFNKIYNK